MYIIAKLSWEFLIYFVLKVKQVKLKNKIFVSEIS